MLSVSDDFSGSDENLGTQKIKTDEKIYISQSYKKNSSLIVLSGAENKRTPYLPKQYQPKFLLG